MVDRDIVLEKIGNIQACLKRIQEKTLGKSESLRDIDIQDIFVLNLQRAVQSTIDLGAHVTSTENLGLVSNLKEIFLALERAKIITSELSASMQSMVGFRNVAIHEYSTIELKVLQDILVHHLQDLEAFYAQIVDHFNLGEKGLLTT